MTTSIDQAVATAHLPNRMKKSSVPSQHLLQYRLMIIWRFALAMFGGYAIAMYSAILIAQIFSDYRASAAMSATLIAFTLQAAAFIWVFMVNKTLKASLGIIVPVVILFILNKMIGH